MTPDRTGDGDVDGADAAAVDGGAPRGEATAARQPRVKICGHTSAADVRASVAAGADAVGVVADVSVDTPREVDVERATELLAAVPPLATSVLVTMPGDVSRAVELVGRTSPDAIQVHGTLSPAELAELGERVHVDVVAAVDSDAVAAADAGEPDLAAYADAADAVLVDTPAADGGGGTGRTHDWERTREAVADLDAPVLLAGGLEPENVADAIATVAPSDSRCSSDEGDLASLGHPPFGVDVASGVESSGGVKDRDAVAAFVRNAQSVAVDDSADTAAADDSADTDAENGAPADADGDAPPDDEHAATEGSR